MKTITKPARESSNSYVTEHKPNHKPLEIALPPAKKQLEQDEEWVVVNTKDGWKKIRLHDYDDVYAIPGLYESWIYDIFGCRSPSKIRSMLDAELKANGVDPASLNVLDLGAGNGYVAEVLHDIGVKTFVGIDIYKEAAAAADRDRPGLYADYVIDDITNPTPESKQKLAQFEFNCLTCVAALGFDDIPPEVFVAAFNEIENGGWAAFTIKTDFMSDEDETGFSALIRKMIAEGSLEIMRQETYVHREDAAGNELLYEGIVGRKTGECVSS